METQVLSLDGQPKQTIVLDDSVFGREVSEGSIYHAIRNELANARVGTAATKTRGQVRGSTRKPWRQKGTGRARAGRRSSPIWVGGGVAFGPQPRDYGYKLPRVMKRVAMKSILSMKARDGALAVVEDFGVESGKTKDLVKILSPISGGKRTVLVMKDDDPMVKRAARNVPWLRFLSYQRLCAHELYYADRVIFMKSAAERLAELYGGDKK